MPDPVTISIAGPATIAIGTRVAETILDKAVNYVADKLKARGEKELADRFARLRSDHKLRAQIQAATERAVKRWVDDHPDRDLTLALAHDTQFVDLPSVRDAIATIAQRQFDSIAAETLRGKFSDVLPTRFDSARVERGVITFLEILQKELVGVSDLRDALKTAADIQTARATQETVARLDAILKHLEHGPTPTDETLENYLNWVIDQHRYLDPRGTMQTVRQVQVLLEEIYVSLQAEAEPPMSDARDRRVFERELDEMMKRDDLRVEEKEDARENLLAHYARTEPRESRAPVELAQLVREKNKLVILGDPGAGKTTLMRYLALRHAQAMKRGEATMPDLGATRLPLYLRLANYAGNHDNRSLADFLPTNIRGEDDGDPALATLIREKLAQGACLVLLDGLDEVIAPDERAQIAWQADALIRAYENAGNRFVVTSRVAGYRTAPLAGDLPHYTVCEMNDEQIKRFLDCWCHAVERFQTPDLSPNAQNDKAQAEIDGITDAITKNPGVRRLAANPLLLRVLALIHRTGARLPQRRIELYRLAADTLIRDWELARGIPQAALVNEAEANRLLAELVAWMHQNKPAGIATEGEVREQLANVKAGFVGKEPDDPEVQNAASEFLLKIRQHTGLFVERAPRRYGFMHLTFEEYFAARWLVAKPREAAKRIRNHLHRPRWEEPILLAIGFYGMEFPDDVSDLVEQAILGKDLGGPSPYEEILHRDLLFALRVLVDQDVNVALRTKIVKDAYELWMDEEGVGKYRSLEKRLGKIIETIQGSTAGNDLNNHFMIALQNENKDVRASAIVALGNATVQTGVVTALLAALCNDDAEVRTVAALALKTATTQSEVVTALLTALADKSENVRTNATFALSNVSTQPAVVTALLATLGDKNENVRTNTLHAIQNVTITTESDVVVRLLADLQDANEYRRSNAALALRAATILPDVITALLAALYDQNEDVRACVVSTLASATSQPGVATALITMFYNEQNDRVLKNVASALSNATAQSDVVTVLLTALHDEHENTRVRATDALRNATSQPEVVKALLDSIHDESKYVRVGVIGALGNATIQPDVVSALLTALYDEDENIRAAAALALRSATSQPNVVAALLVAICDEYAYTRGSAALALSYAPIQTDIVTALLTALHDKDENVRTNAAFGLKQLSRQSVSKIQLDFSDQLCISLKLPGLDNWFIEDYLSGHLFDALMAVAPGPKV